MIRSNNVISAAMLLLIGIGFLAATTVRVMNTHDLINRAKTAEGTVIVTKHAKRHPRIEYTDAAGGKRWFLANEWITGFRFVSYKIGQRVRVLYDPADPVAFSVDDFTSLYTVPIAGAIAGIVFVVLGLYALREKVTFKTKDMVTAGVFFIFGFGLLIITFMCVEFTREFIGKAKITDGVVFELPHGGSHPRIAYTTPSGKKSWFPANGMIFGYKIGERVRVLYDPADPSDTEIDDFGALYASLYFEGVLGICTIVLGIMALFGQISYRR